MHSIAIIGAGPAGNYAAYLLAQKGYQVDVYEQFSTIGNPIQCTGLLTKDVLEFLPELLEQDCVVNTIDQIIVTTKFNTMKVKAEELVVNRTAFDQYIGDLAQRAGANYFFSHKFVTITSHGVLRVRNKVTKKEEDKHYDLIIGADGPQSRVAKLCFPKNKNPLYFGIQAVIEQEQSKQKDQKTYDTFLGDHIPKFFGWSVPESKKYTRVGLAVRTQDAPQYFDKFLEYLSIKNPKVKTWQSGPIPIFNPKNKWYKKYNGTSVFLLGDAATQIKSTTGGGIVPHLRSAIFLAKCITSQQSKKYTSSPLHKSNHELYIHLLARRALDYCSDKDYARLVKLCTHKNAKQVLQTISRDDSFRLVMHLFVAQPKIVLFMPQMLKGLFSVLVNPKSQI